MTTVSGKLGSKNVSATSKLSGANPSSQSRYISGKSHSTHMTRSSSVGVLNQVRFFAMRAIRSYENRTCVQVYVK